MIFNQIWILLWFVSLNDQVKCYSIGQWLFEVLLIWVNKFTTEFSDCESSLWGFFLQVFLSILLFLLCEVIFLLRYLFYNLFFLFPLVWIVRIIIQIKIFFLNKEIVSGSDFGNLEIYFIFIILRRRRLPNIFTCIFTWFFTIFFWWWVQVQVIV